MTMTDAMFKEYALANGYVVQKTSWYLTRLRKAIAARLIFPNAREMYQEPSFTLPGFPRAVLTAFCNDFLSETAIRLTKPAGHLKLEVLSLRVLHTMLQLQLVGPQYQGGLRFVRPAKVKKVRAMVAATLPFVIVSKGDDLLVSFKYVLIDQLGAITPPKELAWTDIDDRRARVVVLAQMREALARTKKTPRLCGLLRRQVEPEYESEEEADVEVEEEVEDENATEAGSDCEDATPTPDSPPPAPREM